MKLLVLSEGYTAPFFLPFLSLIAAPCPTFLTKFLNTQRAPSGNVDLFSSPLRVAGQCPWLSHLVTWEMSRSHTLWPLIPGCLVHFPPLHVACPPLARAWVWESQPLAWLRQLSQREPWFTNCPYLTEATALLLIEHAAFPFYKNIKITALRKMPGDFLSLGHVHHQAKIKSEVRPFLSLFLTEFSIWMWTWSLSLDLT